MLTCAPKAYGVIGLAVAMSQKMREVWRRPAQRVRAVLLTELTGVLMRHLVVVLALLADAFKVIHMLGRALAGYSRLATGGIQADRIATPITPLRLISGGC